MIFIKVLFPHSDEMRTKKREEAFPLQEAARNLVDAIILLEENGYAIEHQAHGSTEEGQFKLDFNPQNKDLPFTELETSFNEHYSHYDGRITYRLSSGDFLKPLNQNFIDGLKKLYEESNKAISIIHSFGSYRELKIGFDSKIPEKNFSHFFNGLEALLMEFPDEWEKLEPSPYEEKRKLFKQKERDPLAIKKALDLILKEFGTFRNNWYLLEHLSLPTLGRTKTIDLQLDKSKDLESKPITAYVDISINKKDYHKYKVAVEYHFKTRKNDSDLHDSCWPLNKKFMKNVRKLAKETGIKVKEKVDYGYDPSSGSDQWACRNLHTEFSSETPAKDVSRFYLGLFPLLNEVSWDLQHYRD